MDIKGVIRGLPVLGKFAVAGWRLLRGLPNEEFPGSREYWERRYAAGGNSGAGSYSILAEFKAEVLNRFVESHGVASVIEFGCGDGNQLLLATYPRYLGIDVSPTVIQTCRERFAGTPTRTFELLDAYRGEQAELALSLDVVYHLVEDEIYDHYMRVLFDAGTRFVIVYASNTENQHLSAPHVRHRCHTEWVRTQRPEWVLEKHLPNRFPYRGNHLTGSFSDFYFYRRREDPGAPEISAT